MEIKLEGGGSVELFRAQGGLTLPQLKKLWVASNEAIVKSELEWGA
jgi:hypothetical protein